MNVRKVILDALRAKFEGVDEKVLNRIARNGAKTIKDEDEAKSFVEDLTIQEVIDSYTDSRVTESIATYEKKNGLKDGKPVNGDGKTDEPKSDEPNNEPKPKDDGKGSDAVPSWAQALIDSNKALSERLDSFEKGKAADTRKSRFLDAIKDAPEKYRKRKEKEFERLSSTFKDDADFDDWMEELTEELEEVIAQEETKGGTVTPPKGGSKGGNDYKPSPALQARAERNKAEATQSVIQGLPANAK